jgi:hypothetical protein
VFVTYPSGKSVNLDASGNVSALGTVASGTWNATTMAVAYGGTGVTTSTGSGSNVLSTSPTLVTPLLGTPTSGTLTNCTFPTLNQNTTGNAATATTATNQSGGTVSATTGAFSGAVTFAGGSGVGSTGDIVARRSSGTTGVYYFVTNGGSVYLYYDGANFSLNGGSFTCSGNVTAYSDERVKTNWRGYGPDFIERLAKVKHGTFDRTDTELTQDGVSAQSLQELLPYSVMENTEGKLSVSYGNAALVAAVKLAERVVALEARLAALEAKG